MARYLIFFMIIVFSAGAFLIYSQEAPEFLWANQAGPENIYSVVDYVQINDNTVDNYGNTFITGLFNGEVTFGIPGNPDNITFESLDLSDAFFAKLDPDGNFLWVETAGGMSSELGQSIAVDSNNNIYFSGIFWENIYFGDPEDPSTIELQATINGSSFIAKYDSGGNILWVVQIDGDSFVSSNFIRTDNNDNLYIAGHFSHTVYFGEPGDPDTIELNALILGQINGFIAKMDNTGNFIWANQTGTFSDGHNHFSLEGIAADPFGNTFITGTFQVKAYFGDPLSLPLITLDGYHSNDIFVAKLDQEGEFLWASGAYGNGFNYVEDITADQAGNAYIAGAFRYTIFFGESGNISLTSWGISNIFVSKIHAEGKFLWAKQAGGVDTNSAKSISTDSANNVYIVGGYCNIAYFGEPGHLNTIVLVPIGLGGNYVAKLDPFGNFFWVKNIRSHYGADKEIISVDDDGNSYVSGIFNGTIYFGDPDDPDCIQLYVPPVGRGSGFIAKLDSGAIGADASVVPSDISHNPALPEPGDTVEIKARVYNYGTEPISQGNAEFYYSMEPNTDLSLIGTIPFYDIQPDDYADIIMEWNTGAELDPRMYVLTVFITDLEPNDINIGNNLAFIEMPLPVELAFFEAKGYGSRADIRWMTTAEIDNLGYNLYRLKADKISPFFSFFPVKLNNNIIPGQGNSSSPNLYTCSDKIKRGNYFYILECISTSSTVTEEYKTRLEWVL